MRRYDCPIVYASPTFCHLTGYSEQEVFGRNCCFLQSPNGNVAKGEPCRFASPEAVSLLDKLCDGSYVSFRPARYLYTTHVWLCSARRDMLGRRVVGEMNEGHVMVTTCVTVPYLLNVQICRSAAHYITPSGFEIFPLIYLYIGVHSIYLAGYYGSE